MGFVVLHIEKPKGNDAGTSAHIERRVHHANADQSREHLNERLVEYPDGVGNRTQAIQRRIETAGITRKIGTNQVRALRIMLSGTPEDMQRIEAAGRLDEWCADNLKWLRDTKVRDLYDRKDEAREKFLDMHEYNRRKESEISEKENRLEQLRRDYEPYQAQEDLNLLLEIIPTLSERLRIAQLCKGIGLTVEAIKKLFNGESVMVNGKLYSSEHDRSFDVQDAKLQIFAERDNPDKLLLKLNGQNIIDWFKQKYQELKQTVRPHIRLTQKSDINNGKGIKR